MIFSHAGPVDVTHPHKAVVALGTHTKICQFGSVSNIIAAELRWYYLYIKHTPNMPIVCISL